MCPSPGGRIRAFGRRLNGGLGPAIESSNLGRPV